MDKRNVVLIGMPGAGKSTIGVLLAKAMGKSFIDTDLLIQQNESELLQNIIDKRGIESFLKVEEEVVLKADIRNSVVATGGSVIYSEPAICHLKDRGTLIYLKLNYNEIEKRIMNIKSRGIAIKHGQNLLDIYKERVPLYEKYADIIINCSGKEMEDIITEIRDSISP